MEKKMIYFCCWLLVLCFYSLQASNRNPTNQPASDTSCDTLSLREQINHFEVAYHKISKMLYDSVAKVKSDDIDFSSITSGLEKKYKESNGDITKLLLGFKLAENYMIHFDSSKKTEYKQKAEPLFYSFLCFDKGTLASYYLKLDINKVRFMATRWNSFSDKDKDTLLFYGLLRGFGNGLPDILKNVE